MDHIQFTAVLEKIHSLSVLRIPKNQSKTYLPSRGIVLVTIKINDHSFTSVLEPDGKGSHWVRIDPQLRKRISANVGDKLHIEMTTSQDWPEPDIPDDLAAALSKDEKAYKVWKDTTPIARWDWIRWINSTKNPQTRLKRINVSISKMRAGEKRPCCFNRSMCCDPEVCSKGVLL